MSDKVRQGQRPVDSPEPEPASLPEPKAGEKDGSSLGEAFSEPKYDSSEDADDAEDEIENTEPMSYGIPSTPSYPSPSQR